MLPSSFHMLNLFRIFQNKLLILAYQKPYREIILHLSTSLLSIYGDIMRCELTSNHGKKMMQNQLTVKDVPTAAPLTLPSKIIAPITPEFKPKIITNNIESQFHNHFPQISV